MKQSLNILNSEIGYKNKVVLSKLNLNFSPGQIHLIIGNNGEGKTTLLKTLAGAIAPIKGVVTPVIPGDVSFLSTEFSFNDYNISGKEYIDLISTLNDFDESDFDEGFQLIKETVSNSTLELSSGMRQILRIKSLSLKSKSVFIWDEPLKSLAPEIKILVTKYLNEKAKTKLVIVTDHSDKNWIEYNPFVYKISAGAIVKDV